MAKNLKKFVNPKFTRTVPVEPMRRLLERHRAGMTAFDFGVFEGDEGVARAAIFDYFAGPDGDGPDGLVAELHRIAAVGTRLGLDLLLQEAVRRRVSLVLNPGRDPAREDPKHVALTAFLDHNEVFTAAADKLAFYSSPAVAEFMATESGIAVERDTQRWGDFERALSNLFETHLHGSFCRVGWYDDGDESMLAITHGTPIATIPTIEAGKEQVLCYRPLETAFLAYAAADGRLKLRRVGKARRKSLAEAFAQHVLRRPGLFAGAAAQRLYTLSPIERAWPNWQPTYRFDPLIRGVRITDVQLDRLSATLVEGTERVEWSVMIRDREDCALARLRELLPGLRFTSGQWRLGGIRMRVDMEVGSRRPAPVIVDLRPLSEATFKRNRFESQVMELLRRNGFCCHRTADLPALAAE